MMTFSSYLQKTFLLYDPLPVRTISSKDLFQSSPDDNQQQQEEQVVVDATMPLSTKAAMKQTRQLSFPKHFYWGAATAAYQIEGGLNKCNWSQWEDQGVRTHDGRPTVEGHQKAGKACNSWNLWDKDVHAMKALGMTMYRFSVEWSRVQPTSGDAFDDSVLQRYANFCQQLLAANIAPMITLHHFTEPTWFVTLGGWEQRFNLKYFQAFVDRTTHVLAPYCRHWTTLNEINGYVIGGWIAGVHPPGHVNEWETMLRVFRHLLVAHSMASKTIRANAAVVSLHDPVVCLALSHVLFLPLTDKSSSFWNRMLPRLVSLFLNYVFNFVVLDAIFSKRHAGRFPLFPFPFHFVAWLAGWGKDVRALKGGADWIAVNHYYRSYVQFARLRQQSPSQRQRGASPTDMFVAWPLVGLELRATAIDNFEKNEMGWDLTPSSMARLLRILWDRYAPTPIIITETGTADNTDHKRVRYMAAILSAIHNDLMMLQTKRQPSSSSLSSSAPVDIRGVLIWTLMDNFEWAEGFRPKFGLLKTNFWTLERTERKDTCDMLRAVFSDKTKRV